MNRCSWPAVFMFRRDRCAMISLLTRRPSLALSHNSATVMRRASELSGTPGTTLHEVAEVVMDVELDSLRLSCPVRAEMMRTICKQKRLPNQPQVCLLCDDGL